MDKIQLGIDSITPAAEKEPVSQWGLASLLMGSFLVLFGMIVMVLGTLFTMMAEIVKTVKMDLDKIGVAAWIFVSLAAAGCFISLTGSIGSLIAARRRRQSIALGFTGLMMSIGAFAVWVVAAIILFSTLHLLRTKGLHQPFPLWP